jgi:hypothetical protein
MVIAALALLCTCVEAQQVITVSAADLAAASTATANRKHVMRAVTAAGASYKDPAIAFSGIPPTVLLPPGGNNRFPDDLSYQGGVTVQHGQSHALYVLNNVNGAVGCTLDNYVACWGNPEDFLTHLGSSNFIHITDQYVSSHGGNRYTNGAHAFVCCAPLSNTGASSFTDGTMQFIVSLVISALGYPTGENDIYDIFLPPGTDECINASGVFPCYSPDNPNTFAFCGYHSSFTFNLGHAVYTVEPFENVAGCSVPPGTPNGSLTDSTANVLSHETFETITDPDINTGFRAINSTFGEVGDLCDGTIFNPISFNGHNVATQAIYSDKFEACATTP